MRHLIMPFLLFCLLVCFIPAGGIAQVDDTDLEDLMEMSLEDLLNMNVFSAARHEQKLVDSPRSVSIVTADEIRKRNYRTTPEALNELVGILVQETNYGGGSPIIRGLVGNQILILIDGIRLNNAIFRLGPNQYLNTVDINQIERIEVVRGTGSVLYGSDALGGLINIITKSRKETLRDFDFDVGLFGRYASADEGKTGRFDLGGNLKKLGMVGGFSFKEFEDLRAGDGVGLQPFTGYDEWDADLKLSYGFSEEHKLALGFQHVNQSNVPRTDKLTSGSDLKREWDPEVRNLLYLQYDLGGIPSFFNALRAGFSYQDQSEDLERIASSSPDVQQEYHDEVKSVGLTFQLHSSAGKRHYLTYGGEYYADDVESRRVDVDFASGVETEKKGTFADESTYRSQAIFIQDEIRLSRRLSATFGLRYSWFHVRAEVDDPAVGDILVHTTPNALTASTYGLYELTKNLVLAFGLAQGFRAPNIDDLTILGSFGSGFEVPNPDLSPEQSLNYEVGLKAHHRKFSGSLYCYLSNYDDLIERDAGTYNGLSFLDHNQNGIQDDGEENVYQRKNVGRARIMGIETEGRIQLLPAWSAMGNVAWIKGENLITHDPLSRIPPVEGKLGIEWTPRRNMWTECYSLFALKQDRLSPGDIADPRIPEGGTPGYVTLNLRTGIDLNEFGNLTVALENVTNEAYRLHSSGIDAPGTNLVLGFRLPLRGF